MTSAFLRAILLLSTILLGVSCQTASPPHVTAPGRAPLPPPETLSGTSWRAQVIDGAAADAAASTLAFVDERRVAGALGCNRYSGGYSADALGLRFASIAATRAICDRPTMVQEERFAAVLQGARGLRFDDMGSLLLLDAAGAIRAVLVQTPARAAE